MDQTTSMYHDADVLVFNTGHWWTHEKTSRGWVLSFCFLTSLVLCCVCLTLWYWKCWKPLLTILFRLQYILVPLNFGIAVIFGPQVSECAIAWTFEFLLFWSFKFYKLQLSQVIELLSLWLLRFTSPHLPFFNTTTLFRDS